MKEVLRVCRKCLPQGETQEEFFASLSRYIERMDDSVKADEDIYRERLSLCGSCDKLMNGMCRLCGCFVTLRAIQKVRGCPDIPAKWEGYRE